MRTISKPKPIFNSKSELLFIPNNSGKLQSRIATTNLRIQIPPGLHCAPFKVLIYPTIPSLLLHTFCCYLQAALSRRQSGATQLEHPAGLLSMDWKHRTASWEINKAIKGNGLQPYLV